jgi:hypothetical protein
MTSKTGLLIEEMVELRSKAWSQKRLAERYGVSISTIGYHCLMNAADPPVVQPMPKQRTEPYTRWHGQRPVNPFTPEDDKLLLALDLQGLRTAAIAREMSKSFPDRPRKPNTIRGRLATLARRDRLAEARG